MISENCKDYLLLKHIESKGEVFHFKNAFGLCFTFRLKARQHTISFIPLNTSFCIENKKGEQCLLLRFSRELIQEDDVEFAMDIMHLFNQQQKGYN